jgi:hypothetical protein
MDLASTDGASASVAILLGTGQGGSFKSRVLYPSGFGMRAITCADLNGDGKLDLVTANAAAGGGPLGTTLSVLLGNGNGTFQPFSVVNLPKFDGRQIASTDFNHDGRADLVLGTQDFTTSGILTLMGNGDGTFAPATYYATSANAPNLSATLFFGLGDLNHDGNPDVVAGNRRFDANFAQLAADMTVLLGQPDGSLVNDGNTAIHHGDGIAVADFNADGRPDVATDDCIQLQVVPPIAPAMRTPDAGVAVPTRLAVKFAPNPIRPGARVELALPQAGVVSLGLYDIRGRLVRPLIERTSLSAGAHSLALARGGEPLAPGVYFYRLLTAGGAASGRVVVVER